MPHLCSFIVEQFLLDYLAVSIKGMARAAIKMTILLMGYEKPNPQILSLQVIANPFSGTLLTQANVQKKKSTRTFIMSP